jgi:hypothetical protein
MYLHVLQHWALKFCGLHFADARDDAYYSPYNRAYFVGLMFIVN